MRLRKHVDLGLPVGGWASVRVLTRLPVAADVGGVQPGRPDVSRVVDQWPQPRLRHTVDDEPGLHARAVCCRYRRRDLVVLRLVARHVVLVHDKDLVRAERRHDARVGDRGVERNHCVPARVAVHDLAKRLVLADERAAVPVTRRSFVEENAVQRGHRVEIGGHLRLNLPRLADARLITAGRMVEVPGWDVPQDDGAALVEPLHSAHVGCQVRDQLVRCFAGEHAAVRVDQGQGAARDRVVVLR